MKEETNYAADQYVDELPAYMGHRRPLRPQQPRQRRRTPQLDPELVCIHEGLIWAAAAIFGSGAFALGYLSGVWGWV